MSNKANSSNKRARQMSRDNEIRYKVMVQTAMLVGINLQHIQTIEEAREWAANWYRELTS